MFGNVYAFKRLVLAPQGGLVSWIVTVGLWAGETAPIPPVVYGLCRLLVEVVPGAPAECGTGSRRWVEARRIPPL